MLKKAWNSPTIMTWLSFSTKTLALFGILPLVLKRFSSGDVALWYLFSTIISLQSLADFGFRQTFSRVISYAFVGAENIQGQGKEDLSVSMPNLPLLHEIISVMKYIYIRLSVVLFFLLSIFGTWTMMKPLEYASNLSEAWISWLVVLIVSCLSFYGKLYMNYLEGLYKIALVRRIETLTSTASIVSSIVVLLFAPSLLNLIIVNQFWLIVVIIRDRFLCNSIEGKMYRLLSKSLPFNKEIFLNIWQLAWRSGISGLMSTGLTNVTGLIYAQIGNSGAVASYLLALRIINQIKEVSMAPFYSKLPLFAMLRVKKDNHELVKIVKRGMFLSHLTYIIGFVFVGFFSSILLKSINSEVQFVSQQMWMLLGVAFFIHRYGAMHIQVYISTNHIISHIADSISGLIFIISSVFLVKYIGIYSIPVGMIMGYLGFYAWYAAKYSYSSLGVSFWKFEKSTTLVPLIIAFTYILFEAYRAYGLHS